MKRMSKEAAAVLYALYSQYLSRRKIGESKSIARRFSSALSIHSDLCSAMNFDDVDSALKELHRLGYVDNDYGSNTVTSCFLTDDTIIDFEYLVKDRLLSFTDFITKII